MKLLYLFVRYFVRVRIAALGSSQLLRKTWRTNRYAFYHLLSIRGLLVFFRFQKLLEIRFRSGRKEMIADTTTTAYTVVMARKRPEEKETHFYSRWLFIETLALRTVIKGR